LKFNGEEVFMHTKENRIGRGGNTGSKDMGLDNDLRRIKAKAYETRSAITDAALHAKLEASSFLKSSMKDIKNQNIDVQDNVVTYIKTNPVKSIAAAFLAGFIIDHLHK